MTSQPWKQTTALHILSNVSRSNQGMKFGQLIEWHEKHFSKKSYAKRDG